VKNKTRVIFFMVIVTILSIGIGTVVWAMTVNENGQTNKSIRELIYDTERLNEEYIDLRFEVTRIESEIGRVNEEAAGIRDALSRAILALADEEELRIWLISEIHRYTHEYAISWEVHRRNIESLEYLRDRRISDLEYAESAPLARIIQEQVNEWDAKIVITSQTIADLENALEQLTIEFNTRHESYYARINELNHTIENLRGSMEDNPYNGVEREALVAELDTLVNVTLPALQEQESTLEAGVVQLRYTRDAISAWSRNKGN